MTRLLTSYDPLPGHYYTARVTHERTAIFKGGMKAELLLMHQEAMVHLGTADECQPFAGKGDMGIQAKSSTTWLLTNIKQVSQSSQELAGIKQGQPVHCWSQVCTRSLCPSTADIAGASASAQAWTGQGKALQ